MAIPVVRELERRGGWDLTVLGLTTASAALAAAGIPHIGFRDLLTAKDERAREIGEQLAVTQHRDGVGVSREESVAYLGLSYADLEERIGREEASRRYAEIGRRSFLPLGPLSRLMDEIGPDVVVATSAPRAEEAAIRTARTRGVPAVCVNDLFSLDRSNPYLWERGYGDVVTVVSEFARDTLVEHGRHRDEIRVTGNPAFDALADPTLPRRGIEWRSAHNVRDRKVVLWASQPEPGDPALLERVRAEILRAASGNNWFVLHRYHPSEPPPPPIDPALGYCGRSEDVGTAIHAADVVVVLTTTLGLEAALCDRPLVKIRLSAYDYTMPYERMGFAVSAESLETVERGIRSALEDDQIRRSLADHRRALPPVGSAAVNVADVIQEFAAT